MNLLSDQVLALNECCLNKFYTEGQVATENLVNSSTPKYKKKVASCSADFLKEFKDVRELLSGRYKQDIEFKMEVKQEDGLKMQRDENNIDRDEESVNLTRANFGYKCAATCINSRLIMLGTVINSK